MREHVCRIRTPVKVSPGDANMASQWPVFGYGERSLERGDELEFEF